ncbi:hypothetical protein ACPWT1_02910 [Ramlibacter sp. MMS24-I3-19]|uniref:hypothetical protein n=1 Tax=Ramlibacter sp. MMS24-I3-19 TaxID=3416606 RepID=UPI003CFD3023
MKNSDGQKQRSGLAELMGELSDEVESEAFAVMKPDQQKLETIAREMLKLEKDMTVPGSTQPDGVRVDRLMQFIEERDF